MRTVARPRGAPDPAAVRQRQRAAWASGDFAIIGTTLQIVAENLVEVAGIRAGEKVLDVGAGIGNASLAAARRFAHVTSTDIVPGFLEQGRVRARAEGLPVTFEVADVEALPFDDARFDVVVSTFGAMYAIDAARAAHEMRRVLRPGGRIALASWRAQGCVGALLDRIAAHETSCRGGGSPLRWGAPEHLAALFRVAPAQMQCRQREFHFRYRSAAHWVQVFRDYHGPIRKAFATLDASAQVALEQDLARLLERANTGGSTSLVVPAAYLEAVIAPAGSAPAASTTAPASC